MSNLHVVKDEAPALSPDELRDRGTELATKARQAAVDAVRESMCSEFLSRDLSLSPSDLRRWQVRARAAQEAWRKVDTFTSELLIEIEKTIQAERVGKKLTVVPTGRPGHYETAWVKSDVPGEP